MSKAVTINSPLVSCDWLLEHLNAENLVILNANLKAMGSGTAMETAGLTGQIPGARTLDIKQDFSELSASFPNTMLSAENFSIASRRLGINHDSAIVVYDEKGIYSSPRAWWMFKAMGHSNIAVLDGGLPAWKEKAYPLEENRINSLTEGNFIAQPRKGFFKDHNEVFKSIEAEDGHILDARSESRFKGLVEEPRKGLRSGHIPGSVNLPYTRLMEGKFLRSKDDLQRIFSELGTEKKALTFSCGSGITACILALGAELLGYTGNAVYDGSWTEWGSITELPVEK